ncbi:MAG: hypothetical protein ACM3SM_06980, partial [Bacteroidota bacterium]
MKLEALFLLCIICLSSELFPQVNDYRIISSDNRSMVLEYTPVYTDTSVVSIEGKVYRHARYSGFISRSDTLMGYAESG